MIADIVMIATAILLAAVTLRPAALKSRSWRATVTPLASIIGSGFLVAGPILGHAAGHWAWVAMAGLCAVSYVFGIAIRENIKIVEPMLASDPPPYLRALDRAADLALVLAYFVSVAYYLYLLAAFALQGAGIIDVTLARIITTAIVAALGILGLFGGLHWLEHVELGSVGIKLALIGGIIAAMLWHDGTRLATGALALQPTANVTGLESVRIMLGLIILVQGFETSRYLGNAYDAPTRVRTMRHAQLLSFAIYCLFIVLLTPFLDGKLPPSGGETHIIGLLRPIGGVVAPFVIGAALMSQLSAAVADMNGSSGLVNSASNGRISVSIGYVLSAVAAAALVWSADIFQIIAYASKAFVLYYGIQAVTALSVEIRRKGRPRWGRVALFAGATLLAVAVILFGRSAEG